MTKRQLTKEEKDFTNRNLNVKKEDLTRLEENLQYNKDLIKKQMYLREFDDKWRLYLRKQKDYEDNKVIVTMDNEIVSIKELIEITEKQLKEGVEEKIPNSVK